MTAALSSGKLCYKCISSGEPEYKIFHENSRQKADGGGFFFFVSERGIEDTLNTDTAWCFSHGHIVDDAQVVYCNFSLWFCLQSCYAESCHTEAYSPWEHVLGFVQQTLDCLLQIFLFQILSEGSLIASLKGGFEINVLVYSSLLWTGKILLCHLHS